MLDAVKDKSVSQRDIGVHSTQKPSNDDPVGEGTQRKAISFQVSHVLVSAIFTWFCVLHLIGLLFFAKGFLLTRLVLDSKSQCSVLPNGSLSSSKDGCWHSKSFDRAVVIIIDALRYDFTVPFQPLAHNSQKAYYHDNFPFLYDTATKKPAHAILSPFIADPPTSTLQRLKGLTTGTLPTFIDIGSNFAGTEVEEDNILIQLKDAGNRIVHLGDDTWHSLFPGYFDTNLTHAYDSFNVWDLHSVDDGVTKHILPLLQTDLNSQWDIVFAHFLGVDHAGHRYGPDHPAMAEKLQQMNGLLKQITESIDDRTLLVVMGDHGMDSKGDHGGESDDEVEAALWMYSAKPHFGRTDPAHSQPPLTAKERPVGQIDLVSTLSILLGLPIPFNNLGTPIVEAFTGPGKVDWKNVDEVSLLAFEQIQNYQRLYARSRELGGNPKQDKQYQKVKHLLNSKSANKWKDIHTAYQEWHRETIAMYRKLWANFNLVDMAQGIFILTASLIILGIYARYSPGDKAETAPTLLRAGAVGTVGGLAVGPSLGVVLPQYFTALAGAAFLAANGGIAAVGFSLYQQSSLMAGKSVVSSGLPPRVTLWGALAVVFTISQAAGFASNSYTIHEDTILMFFLTTFALMTLMASFRQGVNSDRILGVYHSVLFMLLTRVSSYSRLCREEQMPGCRSTFYSSNTSSTSAPWQLLIPCLVALILPEIIKAFYKGTASYAASAGFWIGFSFRLGLILVASYWLLDAANNGNWLETSLSSSTLQTILLTIARCALAIGLPVGIGTFVWAKPCIDIAIAEPTPGSALSTDKPQITIYGYANVYGTRYFLLMPILVLSTILLLPPMGQFSFATCTWQVLSLLEILDSINLSSSHPSSSPIGPTVLALLGSYHFFKTGHQAVLSSIQWNSAFVPLRTIKYPWSPLLIVLNTFGAQILCAVAVPLTVLWKRPISRAGGVSGVWNDVVKACATHVLYYAVIQLATTLWAGHLRRHLMLYRVFMPRFLMASVLLIVVDLCVLTVALTGVRITGLSVGEIFGF